jgi:hypothetical protein
MRFRIRLILAAAVASAVASSATAQNMGGGGQNQQRQGGGQGGQTGAQAAGLPFGSNGAVGLETQGTVSNAVTNAQSNVLGGYYANPYYQGRVGTFGGQQPGGFGQAVYSATGTGGTTGRNGGVNTGFGSTGGRTTGAGGMNSTGGFGGSGGATSGFSGGTSGFGGATTGGRTGQTGFGGGQTSGFGSQTGAFGGGQAGGIGGRQAGGLGGGLGGRQGGQFGNRGGMGATNPNAVAADRAVNVLYQPAGIGSIGTPTGTPLVSRAQNELRIQFDRTTMITSGKTIDVQVSSDGIARLRGTVASQDEKRLAIGLAQLTPGVRTVVSELTVSSAP